MEHVILVLFEDKQNHLYLSRGSTQMNLNWKKSYFLISLYNQLYQSYVHHTMEYFSDAEEMKKNTT